MSKSNFELDQDGRAAAIDFLQNVIRRLSNPECASTHFKFWHSQDAEEGFGLTVDISPAKQRDIVPFIWEQEVRDGVAENLRKLASKIERAHSLPMLLNWSHARPVAYRGQTPVYDGNEIHRYEFVFERERGKSIPQ